jgi:amino acid adenylation domain-containing protein
MSVRLPGRCLHEIFQARVREAPNRVAVRGAGDQVTYGELDSRANRVARRLRAMGVGPDVPVGLCVDRGIDLVVGMLGILKAGGAYVPIDPAYPEPRIRLILRCSGVRIVVAVTRVGPCLVGCEADPVWIDREDGPAPAGAGEPADVTGSSLAYVIFTSGSTGVPKGVAVEHHSVVRLFEQTAPLFGFDHRDVWSCLHSASFDFSVWEIWGALLLGGLLVMVPAETARLPGELHSLLTGYGVTVLNQTPSAFRQLVDVDAARGGRLGSTVRLVILGGERLDVKLLAPWVAAYGDESPALFNMYGITETTVHATYRRIVAEDLRRPEVSPIGAPIGDLRIHLLDESGRPVPDGTPGELHVAGPGLARGYLNEPELTAERFRRTTGLVSSESRLYRSGDRAVREPGGDLLYLGRLDDQIKVAGFRIDPTEIEACLSTHPEVATAVVSPRDHGAGDVRLVASVVPRPGVGLTAGAAERLRSQLDARVTAALPAYMRPADYRFVESLPLTANGKADRRTLETLPVSEPGAPPANGAAPSGVREAVLEICQRILQRQGIAVDSDLFDQGATSLAFVRIVAGVNERFDIALTGSELGDTASVRSLADCAEAAVTA